MNWVPAKELFSPSDDATVSPTALAPTQEKFSISPTYHEDDGTRLEIHLVSGLELKIKAIRLYDEIVLAEINLKRAQALKSFQGVSTGLGSIGSIGWVLATSVVIGAVEGALSVAAASSGANLLTEVIRMEQKLRMEGIFLPVGKIENIETPIPGLWRVPYKREAQVEAGVNFWHQKQFEKREVSSAFIHSGDEFISVQTEDDSIYSIRWSIVERYFLFG